MKNLLATDESLKASSVSAFSGPPERCGRMGRALAKVELVRLASSDAGLKEDVVDSMVVRPRPGARQQFGADTSGAPLRMYGQIFDRSPTTEAHRKDVHVDAGHADQLILIRAGFEQRDVLVAQELRGARDGAVPVPVRRATAGRVEEPLQTRDELGLGTSLRALDLEGHRSIMRGADGFGG
jgi:hypothetical protein